MFTSRERGVCSDLVPSNTDNKGRGYLGKNMASGGGNQITGGQVQVHIWLSEYLLVLGLNVLKFANCVPASCFIDL